jgi:hypothetical protein
MGPDGVSLLALVETQDLFRQRYFADAGLGEESRVLEGLLSGLDSLFALFQGAGPVVDLNQEAAAEIMDYFLQESYRHRESNPEVSLWYLAWASTLEQYFLP